MKVNISIKQKEVIKPPEEKQKERNEMQNQQENKVYKAINIYLIPLNGILWFGLCVGWMGRWVDGWRDGCL